jgi:hypothetical protein
MPTEFDMFEIKGYINCLGTTIFFATYGGMVDLYRDLETADQIIWINHHSRSWPLLDSKFKECSHPQFVLQPTPRLHFYHRICCPASKSGSQVYPSYHLSRIASK